MMYVAEYLSNYREEEPAWIGRYLRGEQLTFKDIMSSRVAYYPGSGYDGTLMKVCNMSHSVHSFLYVDYLLKRSDLERHIAQRNSIRGYHAIGKIEWTEKDLMPNGQYPFNINKEPMFFEPNTFVDPDEKPYCFTLIMERATYYQLFVREYGKAPWIFLLQDHGFGCNYDCFGRGGILDSIIAESGICPTFVLCGDNTRIWKGYAKVKGVLPICDGFHHRRDMYRHIQIS